MTKVSSPRKVLQLALEKIRHGWTRGDYVRRRADRPHDQYCSLGAIQSVDVTSNKVFLSAFSTLEKVVRQTDPGSNVLVVWNDAPERKKHEVIEIFEKAIKIAPTSREHRRS